MYYKFIRELKLDTNNILKVASILKKVREHLGDIAAS